MFYTVYKITNKINDKTYIGKHKTKDLDDGYMGSGKLLKRAIKKHGTENFTKDILHVFDNEEDMNKKEAELVVVSEETYNLCEGGQGGFSYINSNKLNGMNGKPHSELQRRTARKNAMKLNSSRSSEFWSNHFKGNKSFSGRKHSEETKRKIGQANSKHQRGSKNSQYGTCWICNEKEIRKISLEDLEIWMDRGYLRGRKN